MALSSLDLSHLPPIFILSTHLQSEELHQAEEILTKNGGHLSYDPGEARIFLGRILHKKRAAFELRAKGVWTEEVTSQGSGSKVTPSKGGEASSPIVLSDSDTEPVEGEGAGSKSSRKRKHAGSEDEVEFPDFEAHVAVIKLDWLHEIVKQDTLLPHGPYLVYVGKSVSEPENISPSTPLKNKVTYIKAIADNVRSSPSPQMMQQQSSGLSSALSSLETGSPINRSAHFHRRRFGQKSSILPHKINPPKLHRTTTSEYEEVSESDLPPAPAWLSDPHPRPLYSCLRSTPATNPNTHFIAQLTKVKNARLLTLDEIGVRAYSTSIAALSAYPYRITSPLEITRLPGCDQKIATLWIEWRNSISPIPTPVTDDLNDDDKTSRGIQHSQDTDATLDPQRIIPAVVDIDNDKDMQTLKLFHDIWGVGPDTAHRFYFQHGFKDLDDLVEFHWASLTRVQQIGVKYYEEFQRKIPRNEVEDIAKVILQSARRARQIPEHHWSTKPNPATGHSEPSWPWDDPHGTHTKPEDFVAVIVGGWRRGKSHSGDVDVILTHRNDAMTHDLIVDVVHDLEASGWITHTLTLHTSTSDRAGSTLPFRARGHAGHGFDTLDKALCVWQNPSFDNHQGSVTKNPNVHRRVDIIISSWKTIGCAVVGWSGGTTFQRDVRRWAKREKGWKFDSSGVRDRRDGQVVDLESLRPDSKATTIMDDKSDTVPNVTATAAAAEEAKQHEKSDGWQDRERRLMEGMGIGWREPELRCTG